MSKQYDIALIGHYTKDTIVSAAGTRVVNGGAFNYGAQLAARMGLKVAAITRLAAEDRATVEELESLGVDTFVKITPQSTCLRLEYPSDDVDERLLYVTSNAGPFTEKEVEGISAKAFLIGASIRGEVPESVIDALRAKDTLISADVQGFIRIQQGERLVYDDWEDKERILSKVDVLKTDAVEAYMLTGEKDKFKGARILAELGPKEIVLTHRDGLIVFDGGQFYQANFYPTELVGRSGRGDTCIASYISARLTRSPEEATIWAAAATSLKLEAEGPFKRDIDDVHRLIKAKYSK